jgi:hypothetical protein
MITSVELTNTSLTPFPDGSCLPDEQGGWSIENYGKVVILSREFVDGRSDPLDTDLDFRMATAAAPVLGSLFRSELGPDHNGQLVQVRHLPTLAGYNPFLAELFSGLPTAGITCVQTSDVGQTPGVRYVGRLGDDRQLSVGLGPKMYIHDTLFHAPGAAATEEENFAAFRKLYEATDQITAGMPAEVRAQYLCALADGFDTYSGSILENAVGGDTPHYGVYLLAECLESIDFSCPPIVLDRAIERLNELGMGAAQPYKYGDWDPSYNVPWEMKNLPAFYKQVGARVLQVA